MTRERTVDLAIGRWREILPQLGIDSRFLVNKHGPCPLCGGRDRFRFDDKEGRGTYYCNQCGPGSGITLVMKNDRIGYGEACKKVDEALGRIPRQDRAKPNPTKPDYPQARLRKVREVLDGATDRDVAIRYLSGRGLSVVPPTVFGHPNLYYRQDTHVGRYPALVAPFHGPDGSLQSAHRIYLADGLPARKTSLPPVDTLNGGSVRLFDPHDGVLGIAEGVETSVAVFELFGTPTWAVLTTTGVEKFAPPAAIHALVVYGDNDRNFAGQKAAFALANRLVARNRKDLAVRVQIPDTAGADWLDVLNERRRAA